MTPTFIRSVRASWTKAFHARQGVVCIIPLLGERTFPPYFIDKDGFGLGFCEAAPYPYPFGPRLRP